MKYCESLLHLDHPLEALVSIMSGLIDSSSTASDQELSSALAMQSLCLSKLNLIDNAIYVCLRACAISPSHYSTLARIELAHQKPVEALRFSMRASE